ncbi:MAG: CD225/dispanin family protein [Oligosphaeraceae bacterium]
MSFVFKCPHCGQRIRGEDVWIGQRGACPGCGREVEVRRPEEVARQEPPPSAPSVAVAAKPFRSHLALAIFSLVCCWLPLGVVAVVRATQARRLYRAGRQEEARAYGRKAKVWALWNMASGVGTVLLLYILLYILCYFAFKDLNIR